MADARRCPRSTPSSGPGGCGRRARARSAAAPAWRRRCRASATIGFSSPAPLARARAISAAGTSTKRASSSSDTRPSRATICSTPGASASRVRHARARHAPRRGSGSRGPRRRSPSPPRPDASPTSRRRRPSRPAAEATFQIAGTARERPEIGTFCPVAGSTSWKSRTRCTSGPTPVAMRRPDDRREDRHEASAAPCSPRRSAASSWACGPRRRAGRAAPSRGRPGRARSPAPGRPPDGGPGFRRRRIRRPDAPRCPRSPAPVRRMRRVPARARRTGRSRAGRPARRPRNRRDRISGRTPVPGPSAAACRLPTYSSRRPASEVRKRPGRRRRACAFSPRRRASSMSRTTRSRARPLESSASKASRTPAASATSTASSRAASSFIWPARGKIASSYFEIERRRDGGERRRAFGRGEGPVVDLDERKEADLERAAVRRGELADLRRAQPALLALEVDEGRDGEAARIRPHARRLREEVLAQGDGTTSRGWNSPSSTVAPSCETKPGSVATAFSACRRETRMGMNEPRVPSRRSSRREGRRRPAAPPRSPGGPGAAANG